MYRKVSREGKKKKGVRSEGGRSRYHIGAVAVVPLFGAPAGWSVPPNRRHGAGVAVGLGSCRSHARGAARRRYSSNSLFCLNFY